MKINKQLDARWFGELQGLLQETGEIFSALELHPHEMQKLKDEFVASDYAKPPSLLSTHVDQNSLLIRSQKLNELLARIEAHEDNQDIKKLYSDKIHEALANHNLLIAAKNGDKTRFLEANAFIYGRPNADVFAASCKWIRESAESFIDDADKHVTAAAHSALKLLPKKYDSATSLLPSDNTFNAVRSLHWQPGGYFETLFGKDGIPTNSYIDQIEGDKICQNILTSLKTDYKICDTPNGFWAVLQTKRQILRPARYKLKRHDFTGIVAHEIGSHLLESVNGEQQSLRLLEIGLDRYEAGNEGRALLREQIVYEQFEDFAALPPEQKNSSDFIAMLAWHNRVAIHMAVSLASGLNDHEYAFDELYHTLYGVYYFWFTAAGISYAERAAHEITWLITTRVTKGTNSQGGAYLKDIVYLEGNINCWRVGSARPELILHGDQGKFDIANQKHVTILQTLGILPKH